MNKTREKKVQHLVKKAKFKNTCINEIVAISFNKVA